MNFGWSENFPTKAEWSRLLRCQANPVAKQSAGREEAAKTSALLACLTRRRGHRHV
jgi:hypothetical protein